MTNSNDMEKAWDSYSSHWNAHKDLLHLAEKDFKAGYQAKAASDGWIDVNDDLPPDSDFLDSKSYLCLLNDPYGSNGGKPTPNVYRFYNGQFDFTGGATKITHWREIVFP